MKRLLLYVLILSVSPLAAQTIITQWNFNGNSSAEVPGGITSPTPAVGAGEIHLIGGATASFGSGLSSTDPVNTNPPNFSWQTTNYPASGLAEKTTGITINVSTEGFNSLSLVFDQRLSNTAANTWIVYYTLDITAETPVWQQIQLFTFTPAPSNTGDMWYNQRTVDLSAIDGLNNNPNASFKIVSAFDPTAGNYLAARSTSTYASSGNTRFDMITVSGVALVVIDNEAPVATTVRFSGILSVGDSLKASYSYTDAEGDEEDVSVFQWYRADEGGENAIAIPDADTLVYILTADDIGKYIYFEVTPVALSGTSPGVSVATDATGPVIELGDAGVLKINEVYSRGLDTNENEDLHADWIEFYNPGTKDVTLAGLRICDSGQCQMLSVDAYSSLIVPAGGFLALAEDATNSFTFGLSSLGERVILRRANDVIIDSLTFPALEDTQTYGRHNDGTSTVVKLTPPTRGASNNAATVVVDPVTTGLDHSNNLTQLYPVPVRNELTVAGPSDNPLHSISLFNAMGQEITCLSSEGEVAHLSFSELKAGLYLVRLLYKNGERETRKIIKE